MSTNSALGEGARTLTSPQSPVTPSPTVVPAPNANHPPQDVILPPIDSPLSPSSVPAQPNDASSLSTMSTSLSSSSSSQNGAVSPGFLPVPPFTAPSSSNTGSNPATSAPSTPSANRTLASQTPNVRSLRPLRPTFEAFLNRPLLHIKDTKQCLLVGMVGLPARGKSYIAKKIARYLQWLGYGSKILNLGQYRRKLVGADAPAEFFDPSNKDGAAQRNEMAEMAMHDAISFLRKGGQACIYDATNTSLERRDMVRKMMDESGLQYELIWVESICNDQNIIGKTIRDTKKFSPDYAGKDEKYVLDDFRKRIQNYEAQYEPLTEDECSTDSYVKIYDAGRKVETMGIKGYLPTRICFFLMNLKLTKAPMYFMRPGESTPHPVQEFWNAHGAEALVQTLNLQNRTATAAIATLRSLSVEALKDKERAEAAKQRAAAAAGPTPESVAAAAASGPQFSSSSSSSSASPFSSSTASIASNNSNITISTSGSSNNSTSISGDGNTPFPADFRFDASLTSLGVKFAERAGAYLQSEFDELCKASALNDGLLASTLASSSSTTSSSSSSSSTATTTGQDSTVSTSSSSSSILTVGATTGVPPQGDPIRMVHLWCGVVARSRQTAALIESHLLRTSPARPVGVINWRAFSEINRGIYDGVSMKMLKTINEEAYRTRMADKVNFKFPQGESYKDVIDRAERVIFELERLDSPVVVIAHASVLRSLLGYFLDYHIQDIPFIDIPMNCVIKLTSTAYGTKQEVLRLLEPDGSDLQGGEIARVYGRDGRLKLLPKLSGELSGSSGPRPSVTVAPADLGASFNGSTGNQTSSRSACDTGKSGASSMMDNSAMIPSMSSASFNITSGTNTSGTLSSLSSSSRLCATSSSSFSSTSSGPCVAGAQGGNDASLSSSALLASTSPSPSMAFTGAASSTASAGYSSCSNAFGAHGTQGGAREYGSASRDRTNSDLNKENSAMPKVEHDIYLGLDAAEMVGELANQSEFARKWKNKAAGIKTTSSSSSSSSSSSTSTSEPTDATTAPPSDQKQ